MENKPTVGFRIETVPYTAEQSFIAADYDQRIYGVKVDPKLEAYARKLVHGDYSRDRTVIGKHDATVSFSVDLYPGSAVNVAPTYFAMVQACGWLQTTFTTAGISLTPNANQNRVPGTIEVAFPEEGASPRQLVYRIKGAMGKLKITMNQVGQPAKLDFSFQGALYAITTRAYANIITPAGFDTALPPAVLAATFSFFGTTQYPAKFEIDGGEKLEMFSDITDPTGYSGARISDRIVTGTMDPDMMVPADLDLYSSMLNNTTGTLSMTIGGAVPIVISAPTAQIVEAYKDAKREGHLVNQLKIEYQRGTNGNDEVEILQGAKS